MDKNYYYITSEYCRYGELYHYIIKRSKLKGPGAMNESEVADISR